MFKQKLSFENSKGDKLVSILSNSTESFDIPVIILCHGFTTNKDNNTNVALESILNEKNIATFRFDFFGHGESEGDFAEITVSEGVDDILQAINYLKSLGYKKIGFHGGSYGGSTGLMAASKSNDLYVLTLKAPVSNWKEKILHKGASEIAEWKKKGYKTHINGAGKEFRLNYTFYKDFDNNDGYKVASKVIIPTLIVHGDSDKTVPIEQSIKLNDILSDSKLEIIKGAGHNFSNKKYFDEMINFVSSFIVEHS